MRLSKDDSSDIGFALWCLASEAISKEEFSEWILHVIEVVPDPPLYIFDLLDSSGYLTDINKSIPFTPSAGLSDHQVSAISGIALTRGVSPFEEVDEKQCMKAMRKETAVVEQFSQLFPFIEFS